MNAPLRLAATVCVSAAVAAVVSVLLSRGAAPTTLPDQELTARIDRLESRIQDLEVARTSNPVAPVQAEPPPAREVVAANTPDPSVANMAHRLELLESEVMKLDVLVGRLMDAGAGTGLQATAAVPADQAEASRWILNSDMDVALLLRAHEALRGVQDAYSPAMVAALLQIATTNADGQVRADVWRFFDGRSKLPALVAPLVRALQTDSDARAREEAADTLGSYLDDPIVEPALRHAAESDSSDRVREKAQRTLKARRSFSTVGSAGR
jgi:hypothetical protein